MSDTTEETDISLAVNVDNIVMLESIFHTEKLPSDGAQMNLGILNPENRFDVDIKAHRTVLRATVSIQYAIADKEDLAALEQDGNVMPSPLFFNMLLGVTVSTPFMGEAPAQARHMAGAEVSDEEARDKHMERVMRVEAIKAAHAFALARLAEASALSPLGTIVLPLIDADEILVDIMRNEA